MKFLDSTGLEYLWGKLKTVLGGKGDSFALNGQTLSLKSGENVLSSVTLPVGGGSGGSDGEVYSAEEQVIGTWVDGKPLYRRVFNIGYTIIEAKEPDGSSLNEFLESFPYKVNIVKKYGIFTPEYSQNDAIYFPVQKFKFDSGGQVKPDQFIDLNLENRLSLQLFNYAFPETTYGNLVVVTEYTKPTD